MLNKSLLQITSRTKLKLKEVDDVLGTQDFGTDETDGATNIIVLGAQEMCAYYSSPSVACPKCDNDRAKYRLIQIRSADEPMTRCKCYFHPNRVVPSAHGALSVYRFAPL